MKKILTTICFATLLITGAMAQAPVGFNIALQHPSFLVVPSSSYGAAAHQPGTWNRVTNSGSGIITSQPLSDLSGNATGVTVYITGGSTWHIGGLPGTFGDDEILLDHGLGSYGFPSSVIEIRDLEAGSYRLFTYCAGWPLDWTRIAMVGSVDGVQDTLIPNDFSQGFRQGMTHTVHRFTVQAGETVTVEWSAINSFVHDARLDGFQIVPDGTSQAESYCDSNVNSSGAMATMLFSGTPSVDANNLVLGVRDLPQNQFGYFVVSQTTGSGVTPPGSQGMLCIGGALGRHNRLGEVLFSGSIGAVLMPLDLADVPQPLGPVSVMPGETWNWQYWFRDQNPGSTSNFSDGNRVTFTQ